MKRVKSILVIVLALSPILVLFQNATPAPNMLYPADYDYCVSRMGVNYKAICMMQKGINYEWSNEMPVQVDGFSEDMMEPKFSHDQGVLFFNDKPANGNMNIHYALKQPSGRYLYAGTLPGTVSNYLDGVPAVDANYKFYFTSPRNLAQFPGTIFGGQIVASASGLSVNNVVQVDRGLSGRQPGEIDMDVEISYDGVTAITSRATFSDNKGYPDTSRLKGFYMINFNMIPNAYFDNFLNFVNRPDYVVYAPNLSRDGLELYYTFYFKGIAPNENSFNIAVAKRNSISVGFSYGQIISSIKGPMVEAPSLSVNDGQKTLIYHKLDRASGKFRIFKVMRN